MKYKVYYQNDADDYLETVIDVPDHIPYHDPTDKEDVPLYIRTCIEDLVHLDHYEETAE